MTVTTEMIAELGLAMIKIGFSQEEITAAVHAITKTYALEVLSKIKIEPTQGDEEA